MSSNGYEADREQLLHEGREAHDREEQVFVHQTGAGAELRDSIAARLRELQTPLLGSEALDVAEALLVLCGIDPGAECESRHETCGPVVAHDSEGVPLCLTCYAALVAGYRPSAPSMTLANLTNQEVDVDADRAIDIEDGDGRIWPASTSRGESVESYLDRHPEMVECLSEAEYNRLKAELAAFSSADRKNRGD